MTARVDDGRGAGNKDVVGNIVLDDASRSYDHAVTGRLLPNDHSLTHAYRHEHAWERRYAKAHTHVPTRQQTRSTTAKTRASVHETTNPRTDASKQMFYNGFRSKI